MAARMGGAPVYADAAVMLERESLDFIDIVTTVESHRRLVELAASAGIPIICQKPFALDIGDAEAMVTAAARASVPLMVHENFRWQRPMLEIAKELHEGAVGRPHFARIAFRHGFDIYRTQPYLAAERRLAIVDVGVHVLDLARRFMGEVTRLYCRTQRLNPAVRGEDAATMVLDHANGATSVVDISFFSKLDPDPFPQTLVEIEGDAGTVRLQEGYKLVVARGGQCSVRSVEPAVPAFGERPWHVIQDSVKNIQAHWLECLKGGNPPSPSGADNLRTLDLVFAAYQSAERAQAVAIAARDGARSE